MASLAKDSGADRFFRPVARSGALREAMLTEIDTDRAARVESDLRIFMQDELAGCAVKRVLREGDAAHKIVEYAHDDQTDLIVMPTHGNGTFRRFVLGSNAAKVLHDAECRSGQAGTFLRHRPRRRFRSAACCAPSTSGRRRATRSNGQRRCSAHAARP